MKIMNMIKAAMLSAACATNISITAQDKPSNISFCFNDRFVLNEAISLNGVDSVSFCKASMKRHKTSDAGHTMSLYNTYRKNGVYVLGDGERTLVKPSQYSNVDFTNEDSKWCFQRSMESEHFVCFWEKGLELVNNTVSINGHAASVVNLLNRAEKVWDMYVNELGFLIPGKSVTDKTKIALFIVNSSTWRADGSGQDGTVWEYSGNTKKAKAMKVGLFHCNPTAASAGGGVTMAHEVGHVFQYLVSADLGTNHGWQWGTGENGDGGNGWWESCANWQAYQVFPSSMFDGTLYVNNSFRNLLHEYHRYANYFIQSYWCQLYGRDFIGRLWRESTKPEDPVDTYKRMNNVSQDDFNKMIFDYACRAITWDIDGLRSGGAKHQDAFSTPLKWVEGTDNTFIVDSTRTPQNYGFNVIRLRGFNSGETIKVDFQGVAGKKGYRSINIAKAGWRYGFVAQTKDGGRVYGDMHSAKEGTAEMTLPENTTKAWFVVTGAPTEHWHHLWDNKDYNDEQWPYQVTFYGCKADGTSRTFDTFPDDYVRRDTTVVLEANLARDASTYTYVNVPFDMDAVSLALGVSTEQLKSVKCNASSKGLKGTIDFVGISDDGSYRYGTTTSTSSSTVYGHWFTTDGKVCGNGSSAAIYSELMTDKFISKVGQYPARLTSGKTYVIRQAFIYTHTDGKQYKATMEVHLNVL